MSTRISSALLATAALSTACAPESGAPEGVAIECAIGEGTEGTQACLLEPSGDGAFTIHRPDDTFQRFRYDAPLKIIALDGADAVDTVTVSMPNEGSGMLEFAHRDARYRLDPGLIAQSGNE